MDGKDDKQLINDFIASGSEAGFEAIVKRHVNLVYSTALRLVGDPDTAKEITQTVFIILSKKIRSLPSGVILTGWLYRTTQFAANRALRTERRRRQREQEAALMNTESAESTDLTWEQMSPLLEEGMAGLGETDRNALLLRYFENKSLRELGVTLNTSEDTAQKRVSRAIEKLRLFFSKRGIVLSAVVIPAVLSAHAVQAAPAGVVTASVLKGTTASVSVPALVHETLKWMAWVKIKIGLMIGAVAIVVAGAATVAVDQTPASAPVPAGPAESAGVFEEFMLHPPIIKKLAYTLTGEGVPQSCVLKLDGSNALVLSDTWLTEGHFKDTYWRYNSAPAILIMADMNLNFEVPLAPIPLPKNLKGKPLYGGDLAGKMHHLAFEARVSQIVNLGFPEIDRAQEVMWDKTNNRIVATLSPESPIPESPSFTYGSYDGHGSHKLALELKYEQGVPISATLRSFDKNVLGLYKATVEYKYDPNFEDGKLPVEFTRYAVTPASKKGSGQRLYTVKFTELERSAEPLAESEINPQEIFRSKQFETHIYSNNVVWAVRPDNRLVRVMTADEANAEVAHFRTLQAEGTNTPEEIKSAMAQYQQQMDQEAMDRAERLKNGPLPVDEFYPLAANSSKPDTRRAAAFPPDFTSHNTGLLGALKDEPLKVTAVAFAILGLLAVIVYRRRGRVRQPEQKKTIRRSTNGFTLLELLVSIAVIGILGSLLLTALAGGKKKAYSAVCKSNLRQWEVAWMNYTDANNNYFSSGVSVWWARGEWLAALRNFYGKSPELLLCPSATMRRGLGERERRVPSNDTNAVDWGGPTTAWAAPLPDSNLAPIISSYGMNIWAYNPPANVKNIQGRNADLHWRKMDVPMPSVTPLFADAMWRGGGPLPTDLPPAFNGEWLGVQAEMHHFAIERHDKGINILFFDGSVRYTRARDLWGLPWNNHFDVNYAASNIEFPGWMN